MTCEIDFTNIKMDCNNTSSSIVRIDANISYSNFFQNFLLQNKPCILLNISANWPCTKNWIKNNIPDFSYLTEKYERCNVSVSDCHKRYFNAQKNKTIKFEEYVLYWKSYVENGYPTNMPLLYLKDWHLKKVFGENFYTVPVYFASDWLNEYFFEKTDDDYQFVYMGPKGTWTPFHVDVFTSFSWSVNICGKKRWILFPPGEEHILKDNLGNLPYDITKCEHQLNCIEIIQNTGEAIFVPSGWHHQVWNLEDTISVNHNWINGCNVRNMWHSLTQHLEEVKKEISDCIDMNDWFSHCQLMLKLSYGLDFKMFYDFLFYIANKRIKLLTENLELKQFNTWTLGKNHAIFDLTQIKDILEMFINHSDINELHFNENNVHTPYRLLTDINNVL